MSKYISRAGEKLQYALDNFNISVEDKICADFGSSTGGFVGVLLQNGAKKVYSVDTSYGELDWNLRNDPRVVVMERTNAMHVNLPEKADFISIDTGWTPQNRVLPNAFENLSDDGVIISLIKPHYEADKKYLQKGKLKEEHMDEVLQKVRDDVKNCGGKILKEAQSPIEGKRGGNKEYLFLIKKSLAKTDQG